MLGRDGPAAKPAGYLNEARLRGLLAEGFVPDPLVKVHKMRATAGQSLPAEALLGYDCAIILFLYASPASRRRRALLPCGPRL